MDGIRRTVVLTIVSLLFFVTQAYAYTITFGGVSATQGVLDAGLTANTPGIDPTTNTAVLSDWFIETFDLNGGGGFNTLDPDLLITSVNGYDFRQGTEPWAAAPANDQTFYFFAPKQGGNLPASVLVPNSAFNAFQPGLFIDYLGFYFGSVDRYNYLDFFFGNDFTTPAFTISGNDIIDEFSGIPGDQTSNLTNVYVNITFDLPTDIFTAFRVRTTGVALELDNVVAHVVPVAPVPEPSTFILFGAGLLGLVALGRKRFRQ